MSSKVTPGAGVAKEPKEKSDKSPTNKEDGKPYDVVIDAEGSTVWSDTPTLADQFLTLPQTCKEGKPTCSVFSLPDDLDRYNRLIAGTTPQEAPSNLIYLEEREFYEGKWLILVKHSKVSYKKLIPPTKHNIEENEQDG